MTQCSPLTRCAYGFAPGASLRQVSDQPEPAVAVLGRRDGVAVGPGVHEDVVDVGDAPLGERREDVRMRAQHPIAFDELVDGEVGLHPGHVVERLDAILARARPRSCRSRWSARSKHTTVARRAGTVPSSSNARSSRLARLEHLDRGEPPSPAVRRRARAATSRRRWRIRRRTADPMGVSPSYAITSAMPRSGFHEITAVPH